MKKALVLLPVIALAACDKPTSSADLSCKVDKYWQNANALYISSYGDFGMNDTEINVKVETFDNYANVTADNITIRFEKVKEYKYAGKFGHISITYKGNFPGSERTALLHVIGDIANEKILQYDLDFIGQKEVHNNREFSVAHPCTPVKEEYKGKPWNAAVPFHHHYAMPNKIERCIQKIEDQVWCNGDPCTSLHVIKDGVQFIAVLTQEEALALSPNWDYSNMKLYTNDTPLQDYEKDACETLDRLNQFMESRSPDETSAE